MKIFFGRDYSNGEEEFVIGQKGGLPGVGECIHADPVINPVQWFIFYIEMFQNLRPGVIRDYRYGSSLVHVILKCAEVAG